MPNKPKPETTTAEVAATPATKALGGGDHDRVVMASRKSDGTPDQTADFEYIGDKDATIAATKAQLATSAVSAVDADRHRTAAAAEVSSEPDPVVAEDIKAKEKAAAAAEKAAEAEVAARFESHS